MALSKKLQIMRDLLPTKASNAAISLILQKQRLNEAQKEQVRDAFEDFLMIIRKTSTNDDFDDSDRKEMTEALQFLRDAPAMKFMTDEVCTAIAGMLPGVLGISDSEGCGAEENDGRQWKHSKSAEADDSDGLEGCDDFGESSQAPGGAGESFRAIAAGIASTTGKSGSYYDLEEGSGAEEGLQKTSAKQHKRKLPALSGAAESPPPKKPKELPVPKPGKFKVISSSSDLKN